MSDAFSSDRISLWEFCDQLADIRTEHTISLDADDVLQELQDLHGNENDFFSSFDQNDTTCIEELSTQVAHENMNDISQQYEHSLANYNVSDLENLAADEFMIAMTASQVLTFTSDTSETVKSSSTASDSLIAELPPMFKTKLDCPRNEGCHINVVKSLSGGSICKGKDAIGSKHKFSCLCGVRWQENNWRERGRLEMLGVVDSRCIQFLPAQPKRKRSKKS